jgi:alcohol dehydrogenase (cytochrome c)
VCVEVARSAAQAPTPTPGGDWPIYNGTLDSQRYSPLRQINTENAASLTEVCRVKIDDGGAFEAGLIVVGSTLYATTATDTIAIDAATCAIRWRTVYHRSQIPQAALNRGVAYANVVFSGVPTMRGSSLWTHRPARRSGRMSSVMQG